jgi:hypothetical protein
MGAILTGCMVIRILQKVIIEKIKPECPVPEEF